MPLLEFLEALGRLPAEAWLIPPVAILLAMAIVSELLRRARLRRLRAIAAHTGLSVVPKIMNPSEVRGVYRGRSLRMTIVGRRRGTLERRWTRLVVDVKNPELLSIHLWRQDALDSLILAGGGTEIEVGDAAFDRRYVIRSDEPALATTVLRSAALRADMLRADIDSLDLLSSRLELYLRREARDPEYAELVFATATRLADAIDGLT